MAQQKAFSRDGEVSGQTVRSVVDGVAQFSSAYEDRALNILDNHGLPEPDEDDWYSWGAYIDAFEELADTVGPKTVTKIGSEIPGLVDWPPTVDSVEGGLAALDEQYQNTHRGDEIGYYDFEKTGDNGGVMECKNPYPAALDEGLLKATAEKFSDDGAFVRIEQTSEGKTRTYQISW